MEAFKKPGRWAKRGQNNGKPIIDPIKIFKRLLFPYIFQREMKPCNGNKNRENFEYPDQSKRRFFRIMLTRPNRVNKTPTANTNTEIGEPNSHVIAPFA